jgi:hypothetical protein
MASKPKKRKVGRKSPPLTRAMLLPTSAALVRKASLQNHMALVAPRQGHGNSDLAGELEDRCSSRSISPIPVKVTPPQN